MTQVQQISVAGFSLFAFRFVEVAGFSRVMSRGEFSFNRLTTIDRTLILFVTYTATVYTVRADEGVAYRVGAALDAFMCYFTFRGLISNIDDFRSFLRMFLLLLIPYAAITLYETYSRNNLFSIIGGRVGGADLIRDGRLRACGSFRHPSLLGTLGASFLPIYIGLAFNQVNRKVAYLGIIACLGIVWASNSGGPLSCVFVAFTGWLCWKMRTKLKLIRYGALALFILLALAMKAPVWYLIAKISSITGGDGYHRSKLMEQGFNHLDKWALFGMPIQETSSWFPYYIHGTGGADITNQFLSYGIAAGLGSMALFMLILVLAFRSIGAAMSVERSHAPSVVTHEPIFWGLGVMLLVHIFNWLGINYFDQTSVVWYAQLAALSSLTSESPHLGRKIPELDDQLRSQYNSICTTS